MPILRKIFCKEVLGLTSYRFEILLLHLNVMHLHKNKPTSKKDFSSFDLATDLSYGLDYGVAIAPGFCGTSNNDPQISRL